MTRKEVLREFELPSPSPFAALSAMAYDIPGMADEIVRLRAKLLAAYKDVARLNAMEAGRWHAVHLANEADATDANRTLGWMLYGHGFGATDSHPTMRAAIDAARGER